MSLKNFDICIIIPCFNTNPFFIEEAVQSIKSYKGNYSYSIIIVNDGSENEATICFLKNLEDDKITVIHQSNKGPASARNIGVQNANSEFILFLDADDRIKPAYIERGITILKTEKKTGVVYANANAFGDNSRPNFIALPFDIAELLIRNFIPMCSVIRKQVWIDVNGIDENLMQYEDWEFWIRIYKAGWNFTLIKEPMFDYRIQSTSLIAQSRETKFKEATRYIYSKHPGLVYEVFHQLYANRIIYYNDMQKPVRSFLKYFRKKYL